MPVKVLLSYIVYPLAMGTYFRRALERRHDVDLKVCGPYTAEWIPWLGGMSLPYKYAIPPDISLSLPPNVGMISYDSIKTKLGDWKPDVVIACDAGLNWSSKPQDGYVVTIGTDPHVLDYTHARKISDKFFNMQKFYSEPNDVYLPYAYDPEYHRPDESVEKDTDAVLIGMPYEQRIQWVNELRKHGVSVIFENGPVFDEARALYNRGRIGLNWSSMNDLNARAFEIPAMKLYPVVNNVPDWWEHESLHHHHIFNNLGEAVEAVLWAKDNPEKAQLNAEEAYNLVQGQTYDARIEQLLKECGYA